MKSKQILFFGTKEDLRPIIRALEDKVSAKYYQMGLFEEKSSFIYKSIDEMQDFGRPKFGDWNKDLRFMMIPEELELVIREVPQKNGGTKYAVDPLENQTSICFQFGGIVYEGVLLAGTCGTSFLSEFALNTFNIFFYLVKKDFCKVGQFYVGKNAQEKMKDGWRLVTNEKLSREYDLTPG